jgi:multisubunit Na+/H+ antiporter MnhG subunit
MIVVAVQMNEYNRLEKGMQVARLYLAVIFKLLTNPVGATPATVDSAYMTL